MLFFEIVIACCSSALCSHCAQADLACLPYPALMAFARAALAFIAGMPAVSLDPELALALFVAPTLLDARTILRRAIWATTSSQTSASHSALWHDVIGEAAFQAVEEELDRLELSADVPLR